MEFVLCCLGGSFFWFWGWSSDLQNDPNLQASLNFQAGPTNKSFVLQEGWDAFASRLSQYKFESSVFQDGWWCSNYNNHHHYPHPHPLRVTNSYVPSNSTKIPFHVRKPSSSSSSTVMTLLERERPLNPKCLQDHANAHHISWIYNNHSHPLRVVTNSYAHLNLTKIYFVFENHHHRWPWYCLLENVRERESDPETPNI